MKLRFWIFILIVLCVGGGAALWVRSRLEKGPVEEWVGYQGEARYNDFLMAQRFLEKSGAAAKSLWRFPTAEDLKHFDALLLPRRGVRLSPGQADALLKWVEDGGFLMAGGAWPEEGDDLASQDPLFAVFGVRKRFHRLDPKVGEEAWKAVPDHLKPADVQVGEGHFRLQLEERTVLERSGEEPSAEVEDAEGPKLLLFHRGKGQAVLFNGLGFLDNNRLPNEDHAAFLAAVLEDRKSTAIVVREEAPSLRLWLMERARMPLAALGLLILLALWKAMPRFGPFIPDPVPDRRSLLEHLAACGRFQWRHHEGRKLLQAAREAMLARLQRVHPAWAVLPPDQLCARLAVFSGLPEPRVFKALRYDRHAGSRDFLDVLQTLDFIRKKL